MSSTVTVRNKRDYEVEIPEVGVVGPGETIEVPSEIATGKKPQGEEGDPEFRPGTSGLLAQSDAWEKVTTKRKSDEEA